MDNWRNRGTNMCCETCMWFVPKVNLKGDSVIGRCRRRAPTMAGFPVMFLSDWCGEHKLGENSVVAKIFDKPAKK